MSRTNIITGLDVGSNKIRVVVGQYSREQDALQIIGATESDSHGIINGNVVSIEDVVSSISTALEKIEKIIGMPINKAGVGISGSKIKSIISQGVVAVAKADGEVKDEDVTRVIEAAEAVSTPPNYEILHTAPRNYKVDNQEDIKDPIGMNGVRLEVNVQIIMVLSSQIKTITKCIYRTGVEVKDLVFSILADAESVLNKEQKELGCVLVNIGASTTDIAVYEEGDLMHAAVLPIGSSHITNDLAIGLRTSIKVAEQVKIEHATCIPEMIRKREEINLNTIDPMEERKVLVSKLEIAKITQARVEEIFELVAEELKAIDRFGMLPAGVILTGGGSKLTGLVEHVKNQLELPVFLAKPIKINSIVEKVYDLSYSNALGLVLWQYHKQGRGTWGSERGIISTVTDLLKSFIPNRH